MPTKKTSGQALTLYGKSKAIPGKCLEDRAQSLYGGGKHLGGGTGQTGSPMLEMYLHETSPGELPINETMFLKASHAILSGKCETGT
ncbi:hypothetical protein MKZ38_003619 [Zalerion maritima]|uniref:Uncharacterized protein n=1 Tax=Zalerion maritima TaxID=339359 RepID=A0AAD5WQ51_9PEZI|nr:hypothetical protein MKZ38_003619 [Zalerion maritima]